MSDEPIQHDVFRFLTLRAPKSVDPEIKTKYFVTDTRPPKQTIIGSLIEHGLQTVIRERFRDSEIGPNWPADPLIQKLVGLIRYLDDFIPQNGFSLKSEAVPG